MNPIAAVDLALKVLDEILTMIAHLKSQAGMSADELLARSDAGDLANKDAIKSILAGG
jgi:hypothetical protein